MSAADNKLLNVRYVLYLYWDDCVVTNTVFRSAERVIDVLLSVDYKPHHGCERVSEPQSREEMINKLKNFEEVRLVDRARGRTKLTTIVIEPTEYDNSELEPTAGKEPVE